MADFKYMVSIHCDDMEPEQRYVGHNLSAQADVDNYVKTAINEIRSIRNGKPGLASITVSEVHHITDSMLPGTWIKNSKDSTQTI